jgi:hypothetical protein
MKVSGLTNKQSRKRWGTELLREVTNSTPLKRNVHFGEQWVAVLMQLRTAIKR